VVPEEWVDDGNTSGKCWLLVIHGLLRRHPGCLSSEFPTGVRMVLRSVRIEKGVVAAKESTRERERERERERDEAAGILLEG
jgi:hypothetical protein